MANQKLFAMLLLIENHMNKTRIIILNVGEIYRVAKVKLLIFKIYCCMFFKMYFLN
jgi:hypothetical protein